MATSSSSPRKMFRSGVDAGRISGPGGGKSIIDLLDDNLLLRILERVEDRFDRHAWSLACKHLMRLEASTKRRLQLLRPEVLEGILHRYPGLLHLDLSHCIQLRDEQLASVGFISGGRLQSINLSRVGGFSSAGLTVLARHSPQLVEVDLSNCSNLRDCDLLAVSQLSGLKSLKLSYCHCVTDIGLGCLAAGCKKIEFLSLKGCLGISDAGVRLVAANCKSLRTLDLSYTEVTDEGLGSIATLEKLEVLNLVSCNNIDDEGLRSLQSSCKSLLKLDVSRCSNVSDAGLAALASGQLALQQLTLSYCSVITDDLLARFEKFDRLQAIILDGCQIARNGLPFIAKGCKQLRVLSLSKCRGVTDNGIAAVAGGCAALHKLDLTCCRELTNASLAYISKECKGLESLKMESCPLISEDGFCNLGDGCPRLQELDFTECNLNDTGLKYLSKCTALRSLKLGFCSAISDKGAAFIGARCCNLRELDFYRSKGVGDAGVAAIAAGCPKIKVIDLSYCTKITDSALQSLSQLRELQRLELRGCSLVTSAGLAVMASGCKRLTEIDIKRCSQIGNAGLSALSFFCPGLRMVSASLTLLVFSSFGLVRADEHIVLSDIRCRIDELASAELPAECPAGSSHQCNSRLLQDSSAQLQKPKECETPLISPDQTCSWSNRGDGAEGVSGPVDGQILIRRRFITIFSKCWTRFRKIICSLHELHHGRPCVKTNVFVAMADSVKLITFWACPYAMRALLGVQLKGIEYENILEDLSNKSQLLLESNPVHKKVPVLIHNGKIICESSIILEYVDDVWHDRGPRFLPGDAFGRAEQRFWGDFVEKKLGDAMMKAVKSKDEELAAAANKEFIENCKVFEGELAKRGSDPFFGGKRESFVDILVTPLALWLGVLVEVAGIKQPNEEECPRLNKLFHSVLETPAAKAVLPDVGKFREFVNNRALPHLRS